METVVTTALIVSSLVALIWLVSKRIDLHSQKGTWMGKDIGHCPHCGDDRIRVLPDLNVTCKACERKFTFSEIEKETDD